MTVLVLARHGESEWNSRQLITGWSDPPLSARGEEQARRAGARLAAGRVPVRRVYTSLLGRAARTASIITAVAGTPPVELHADWRLNERHLGRLEGMTKAEVTALWGNSRRKTWRDDDLAPPPALDPEDPRHPRADPRYRHVPAERLPSGERTYDTEVRVLEFWHERVIPDLSAGISVMVVSHLGPLRILARHLCPLSSQGARRAGWPHAAPLVWAVSSPVCCPPRAGGAPG